MRRRVFVLEWTMWNPKFRRSSCGSHNARVRAGNAIVWMSSSLQLGRPILVLAVALGIKPTQQQSGPIKPNYNRYNWLAATNAKKSSSTGMECKQALAAQPGMLRELEDAMEIGAATGNPTWLALLASWLQSMTGLRLGHILRRSVPVERFEGWMTFFCKRGVTRYNQSGFYWGVPAVTTSGYDWANPFLVEYALRRQSAYGKEMMGMIFRTDNYDYLSANTVNALTMSTVAGVIRNPEQLRTYSWRRILPTMARHLKLMAEERPAKSSWRDAEEGGDEAPITLKKTEREEGMSIVCKLVCSSVFKKLARDSIHTFDEISAHQWESMTKEAVAGVQVEPLEFKPLWRNPDIAGSEDGFKVKKAQPTFPERLS